MSGALNISICIHSFSLFSLKMSRPRFLPLKRRFLDIFFFIETITFWLEENKRNEMLKNCTFLITMTKAFLYNSNSRQKELYIIFRLEAERGGGGGGAGWMPNCWELIGSFLVFKHFRNRTPPPPDRTPALYRASAEMTIYRSTQIRFLLCTSQQAGTKIIKKWQRTPIYILFYPGHFQLLY